MDVFQVDLFDDAGTYDEVGTALYARMSGDDRRSRGITLTPQWLVELMLKRLTACGPFDNIVDAGAGSGRFCIQAARLFPGARIWAVERSEDMCAALRANLAAQGLQQRVQVIHGDFRDAEITLSGRTAFVGNPPYVRHHDIEPAWKRWYAAVMAHLGQRASQLAGLHLHLRGCRGLGRDTGGPFIANGQSPAFDPTCSRHALDRALSDRVGCAG